MDLRLSLMTGIDIPIPDCQLILHQPTIEEIAYIGEESFFSGAQCLCINKSMYKNELPEASTFEVFNMIINNERAKNKKYDVRAVLTLLFPNYKIVLTPRAISFNLDTENFTIDEGNFEALQSVLTQVFCLEQSGQDNFNPANAAAQEIANKLMRARQRIAEQKNTKVGSIFSQYLSILTIGLKSMGLEELKHITVYQLYDLVERFMLYNNWDLDVKTRLAGGSPDSKPDNWMKVIH